MSHVSFVAPFFVPWMTTTALSSFCVPCLLPWMASPYTYSVGSLSLADLITYSTVPPLLRIYLILDDSLFHTPLLRRFFSFFHHFSNKTSFFFFFYFRGWAPFLEWFPCSVFFSSFFFRIVRQSTDLSFLHPCRSHILTHTYPSTQHTRVAQTP